MRFIFLFGIIYISSLINLNAQTALTGIVADKDTSYPLEFVDVYNESDHTSSNADGKFTLYTDGINISFNLLGYEKYSISIDQVKSDTIFLKSKFYELDEVIVSNANEPIFDVFDRIETNYPFKPYSETFFLRSSLKKDNRLVRLQDINGSIQRKTLLATSKKPMPKKNYVVNIENMRKAGITSIEEQGFYFEMFSLKELLTAMTTIYVNPKSFDFDQKVSRDNLNTKFSFSPKPSSKFISKGFYLVNNEDLAFNEFYLLNDSKNEPYHKKRGLKYRTIFYELDVKFEKDKNDGKYYLDKAKINATVEVIDSDSSTPILYSAEYQWYSLGVLNTKVKKNISINKDLFKIDKPYKSDFWQTQNQLLLTEEMEAFLSNLGTNSRNEFRFVSNIDDRQ